MPTKISVENERQSLFLEDKETSEEMTANRLCELFYRVMVGIGYSEDVAKSMFSDEVDI